MFIDHMYQICIVNYLGLVWSSPHMFNIYLKSLEFKLNYHIRQFGIDLAHYLDMSSLDILCSLHQGPEPHFIQRHMYLECKYSLPHQL